MTNNWITPQWILNMFEDWFDPCPLNDNPKVDGLSIEWKDRTYVNPPYSNPLSWVKKAIEENKKGKRIVLLLKVDTSTKWFSLIQNCSNAHILWINKRLKFRNPNGENNEKSPAGFPSMLVILSK